MLNRSARIRQKFNFIVRLQGFIPIIQRFYEKLSTIYGPDFQLNACKRCFTVKFCFRIRSLNLRSNIAQLAREGIIFNNAFCTHGICTPSQACVLAGQYNHNNGVFGCSGKTKLLLGGQINDWWSPSFHQARFVYEQFRSTFRDSITISIKQQTRVIIKPSFVRAGFQCQNLYIIRLLS